MSSETWFLKENHDPQAENTYQVQNQRQYSLMSTSFRKLHKCKTVGKEELASSPFSNQRESERERKSEREREREIMEPDVIGIVN